MKIEDQIKEALEDTFKNSCIEIINESHLHAGHSGDDGSGESHFKIILTSSLFENMSRIERQRFVHKAIGKALIGKIHALNISCRTP